MASHEEGHEVADFGALGVREPGEAGIRHLSEPEPPELAGEACPLDPPERLEELDERDPGRVRCPEQIGRRRAGPRRPGWIEKRGDVSRVPTH